MKRMRLCVTLLAGAAACSSTGVGGRPYSATPAAAESAPRGDTTSESPVVQVRGFANSTLVSIVAWDSTDDVLSLRGSVDRNGLIVGERRYGGDHRLSFDFWYARSMGGFKYATDGSGKLFLRTTGSRDVYACFYGNSCAPRGPLGVEIPDSLLRANRDSLVVRFVPKVGEQWTVTLRHGLVAAYLSKVDSVVGQMRKSAAHY